MATLTVVDVTTAGAAPSFVACAGGGDQFNNDGHTMVEVKNASGSPITVTFVAQTACNQGSIHSTTVSVPATTGDRMCGPFDPARYNDANGNCQITYSAVTSLTVAVISL